MKSVEKSVERSEQETEKAVEATPMELNDNERAVLGTLSTKYQQRDRRDYLDLSRLFSPFRVPRSLIEQLYAKGLLEREKPNSSYFRPSEAAWAALGIRIVRLDVSTW